MRQFDVRYDRWAFRRPGVNFRSVKFDQCNAAESNSATSFLFFHFAALPSAFWLSALRHKNEDYPETTHVCNRRAVFAKFQMFYSQVSVSISSKSFLLNQLLTLHCFHSFATVLSRCRSATLLPESWRFSSAFTKICGRMHGLQPLQQFGPKSGRLISTWSSGCSVSFLIIAQGQEKH